MSQFQSYRHERTGKVGQFRPEVAALFPQLKPVVESEAQPESSAPVIDEPTPIFDTVEAPTDSKKEGK